MPCLSKAQKILFKKFSMTPILGAIIAAAMSGAFSSAGTIMQNKYNSPASQRRRLRKAGLPLAYMYEGKVNQQSDVPKMSLDPTLGASSQQSLDLKRDLGYAGLDLRKELGYQGFNMQQKGFDLQKYIADLRADISKEGLGIQKKLADARIPQIQAQTDFQTMVNELKSDEKEWLQSLVGPGLSKNPLETNQTFLLNLDRKMKLNRSFMEKNQKQLSDITLSLEQKAFKNGISYQMKVEELKLAKQKVLNLVSQDELLKQLWSIRDMERIINEEFEKGIENMPDWVKTLFSIGMKLFKPAGTR